MAFLSCVCVCVCCALPRTYLTMRARWPMPARQCSHSRLKCNCDVMSMCVCVDSVCSVRLVFINIAAAPTQTGMTQHFASAHTKRGQDGHGGVCVYVLSAYRRQLLVARLVSLSRVSVCFVSCLRHCMPWPCRVCRFSSRMAFIAFVRFSLVQKSFHFVASVCV